MPASPVATGGRPRSGRRIGRVVFVLVAVGFAIAAIASQWSDVRDGIVSLSVPRVGAASGFATVSLVAAFLAWRETLAGLGHRIPVAPAARIFFLAQLSKYVPGSIWPILGQVELAHEIGVRRERTATAGIVVLTISFTTGLFMIVPAVPALLEADAGHYVWLLVLIVPLTVVLHPRVLTATVRRGLRLLRRPDLEAPLGLRTVLRVSTLTALANVCLGLQVWQLAIDLGADGWHVLPLAVGAYGLAAAVSLLVVPLPAGAGLREAILVLLLAPEIGVGAATVLAVVARLILTVLDVAAAGAASLGSRRAQGV